MKRKIFFLIFSFALLSCQKYKVNHLHPEMIGDWYHHTGIGTYYSISIFESGRGYIYEKNASNDGLDTQGRAWLIKDGKLIFSRWKREEFSIDQFPTVADSLIINNFDTIAIGRSYMVLDGNYFIKNL